MLLSCYINLIKFKKIWLSKIFGMTYNLQRREYLSIRHVLPTPQGNKTGYQSFHRAPRPNQSTGREDAAEPVRQPPLFLLNVQNGKTKGPFILHGGHPWTVRPAHHHHTCDGSSDHGGRVIRASEPRAAHDTRALRRTQRTCFHGACKSEQGRLGGVERRMFHVLNWRWALCVKLEGLWQVELGLAAWWTI